MKASLADRIEALRTASAQARGRIPDDVADAADVVVNRADQRLALSADVTVVALAGATGSGKSSLFNALCGKDLAHVGVRRPTTSQAMAVTFGEAASGDVLSWLGIDQRHRVDGGDLASMVLVDLPDHDSTTMAHRQEVDRLVQLVDVLVWVVDPQKYADAALHEGYLQPLARHAPTMLVALNQVDRLPRGEVDDVVAHVKRLLATDGVSGVEVVPVSAVTGSGLDVMRRRLHRIVSGKKAAVARLTADVVSAASAIDDELGPVEAGRVRQTELHTLYGWLGQAAGVPKVADAVHDAWRQRGARATGWPVVAWVGRFRPDPLKRLHLDRLTRGRQGELEKREVDPVTVSRTGLSGPSGVQQARVDSAIRSLADSVADQLPLAWRDNVRAAARRHRDQVAAELDLAVASTDLGMHQRHSWWRVVTVLQWLLVATVLAGLGWLAVDFALLWFQLPPLPSVQWHGWPVPTLLVVGGVVAGLLLALLARLGVAAGAKRARRRAHRALDAAVCEVADRLIVDPMTDELSRHHQIRSAVKVAQGR